MATGPQGLTRDQALEIAREIIRQSAGSHDMVVEEDKIVERDFGWVFFYNARQFLETGDYNQAVPGNGPLVVLRSNGATEFLTTSLPPEVCIDEFEQIWRENT